MSIVLVPPGAVAGSRVQLDDGESHHLRVRRVGDGEAVELRDGAGLVGRGRVIGTGRAFEVEVEAAERRPRPAGLTVAVGAGDRDRFAWLVEKGGELGVTSIVPLELAHTRGVATRLREGHLAKVRRHALEAVKQCGAAWATAVEAPAGLSAFLEQAHDGHRWLADAAGAPPPVALDAAPVTIVIGPEGGFEDRERRAVLAAGFSPVVLGSYVLRFETAALAAAVSVATARLRGSHG